MFGGDNELGNILQEAVKLKSAQMGQKRQTYEKWPFFVQHTLFHGEKDDFKAWRQLPFDEKIEISERIKEEGNELFQKGSWSDAVDKYEEAATLVYYCYSTDPGWRQNNRGIDDDVLVLVNDEGSNEDEKRQQQKLRLACCLNLAACKQKLEKYDEAIAACDVALELDPQNVKGLYRRAEARVRPSSSTAYDLDLAIKDLAKAHSVDPRNSMVEKLLTRLREERKVQREKDSKTFTGMFNRGEIYEQGMERARDPCQNEVEMREIQKRIEEISDDDPIEKRIKDAELLRDLYMRNGKEDEAKELNEKIKAAKQALKDQAKEASTPSPPPKMDWSNPTPEMIEDAKKHGLDLTDPAILAELQRLEEEGIPAEGDESTEGGSSSYSSSSSSASLDAKSLPMPEVDWSETVPWGRYALMIFVIAFICKIIHLGAVRYVVVLGWRRLLKAKRSFSGHGADTFDDDEGPGLLATAYEGIFALFRSAPQYEDEDL